jgi:hypothetical protein
MLVGYDLDTRDVLLGAYVCDVYAAQIRYVGMCG